MRKQLIKGSDNGLIEILEDDQNGHPSPKSQERGRFHPVGAKLEKLSKDTKKALTKPKK